MHISGFGTKDKHQIENILTTLFHFSVLRSNFQNFGPDCLTVLKKKKPWESPVLVYKNLYISIFTKCYAHLIQKVHGVNKKPKQILF